jgi:hypothetical protein
MPSGYIFRANKFDRRAAHLRVSPYRSQPRRSGSSTFGLIELYWSSTRSSRRTDAGSTVIAYHSPGKHAFQKNNAPSSVLRNLRRDVLLGMRMRRQSTHCQPQVFTSTDWISPTTPPEAPADDQSDRLVSSSIIQVHP